MSHVIDCLMLLEKHWWPYIVHATWQSTLLGIVILALVAALRRRSAALRYGLLAVALLKFAIPPMLAFPTGLFSWTPVNMAEPAIGIAHTSMIEARDTAFTPSTNVLSSAPNTSNPVQAFSLLPFALTPPNNIIAEEVAKPSSIFSTFMAWQNILFMVHAIGGFSVALWILYSWFEIRKLLRRCRKPEDLALQNGFSRLSQQMGLRRKVQLLIAPGEVPPMGFGVFSPTVLLSDSLLKSLSPDELAIVLAHELAHHRRKDTWFILLEDLLVLAWWFNPVLWLLVRELRKTREDCCDDLVLAMDIADNEQYCNSLMSAAESVSPPKPAHIALGFADHLHPLGRRFKRIMDTTLRRSTKVSVVGVLFLLALGLAVLPGLRAIGSEENQAGGQATSPGTNASAQSPAAPPAAPAPAAKGIDPAQFPGEVIFEGRYKHRSRGGEIPEPSELIIKQSSDGGITALTYLPFMNAKDAATGDVSNHLIRYASGPGGQPVYPTKLEFQNGKAILNRHGGAREDADNKELSTPAGAEFDPNTRPDSYCAANVLLRRFDMKAGQPQEFEMFDWDNTGEGLAGYRIKLEYVGKEEVNVAAGVFEANHILLTQMTSADTWFKKRAGNLTDFWLLDNGIIVKIVRHREPYEVELYDYKTPGELPGFLRKAEAPLTIVSAVYGAGDTWVDVTQQLAQQIRQNTLNVKASNELVGGNPVDQTPKTLNVHYRIGDTLHSVTVKENEVLQIPAPSVEQEGAPSPPSSPEGTTESQKASTTVTGRITDTDGHPISGAQLTIQNSGSGPAHNAETRSGSDGHFVLNALPSNSRLLVSADGYAPVTRTQDVSEGANIGWDFILPKSAHVSGRVVDTNNKPQTERVIELWAEGGGAPLMPGTAYYASGGSGEVTNSEGIFDMPNIAPGKHRVIIYRSVPSADRNMEQIPINQQFLDVHPGERIENLVFVMNPPEDYVLAGHVTDAAGNPLPGIVVETFIPHGRHWWIRTDKDGAYYLDGLDGMGRPSFQLYFNGINGTQYNLAIPDIPLNTKDTVFIVPGNGGIQGIVRNAKSGDPLATYEITVQEVCLPDSGAIWTAPPVKIERDPDAGFTVSDVPAGIATVEVCAEGLGVQRFSVPVEAGKTARLDCGMMGPAVISGRTTMNGGPMQTSIVINGKWLISDKEGYYSFDQFPNGKTLVWFFIADGWYRSAEVELKSGETARLDMDMGGSCEIRGTVTFPEDTEERCAIRLAAKPAPDGWSEGRPNVDEYVLAYDLIYESGQPYHFPNIPPGRWYLMAGKYRPSMSRCLLGDSKEIELKEGESLTVDFNLGDLDK